ncbi:alpha-amylase family glycosyl hydrolase [Bythopirellula goksoeyrii]|uniref:Cyclomaltodextrin glucanotransferase n=1 Tax=Bythopirellula goksoeyrii TaxID=1400387 RepID=A0A5B9QC72_9BACT|nr:alpha-amylase family glycosyl hydrolase [Bythopirellula goksoeyrii]QEG36568.1 Cyclomaltodextrin glucanotransferase precursor [Bythopirellula goksoeyrii]
MIFTRLVRRILVACALCLASQEQNLACAQDVSAPAMLQMFEARWQTIEDRQVDLFYADYGAMWLPPPQRADTGPFSVGYDLFDRFDLGKPQNETLYGTENGLKSLVNSAHRAGMNVYTDLIWNHNGFGSPNEPAFVALGGYPGFVMNTPGDQFGDFHDPFINFDNNPLEGRLAGLTDIAQEKNYQFIRHPVAEGDPDNIPAGTIYNKPDPNNTRFYTDQDLGGTSVFDPALNANVTLYDFNTTTPLAGDPIMENATGLLMRNARWMVQEIGVDGFRTDAIKHMPTWVLNYLDQAVFRANPRLNHDGTFKPVYSFGEVLDGNKGFVQEFIRHDLPNPLAISPSNTTVGGNRDALDFPLFFALRSNLTGNGLANNWHGIRGASQDFQDDGLQNGSQGVSFVDSHDHLPGGFPFLKNVAYAYTLMRPGNALVYLNAKEFGENRDFPNDGKDDALGGFYGETITKLVEVRSSHGRGDFHERWIDDAFNSNGFSNIYIYERSNSAIVGLNSRNDAFVETRSGVQTNFAPGSILVELTGNAADPTVDPGEVIPETVKVNGSGQINMSIPSNDTHGRGYVIYGLATPQGSLNLTNVAGTIAGAIPTAGNNGTARLGDIDVIRADSFAVQLNTTPISLVDPTTGLMIRDFAADGDTALVRLNEGEDLNNLAGIDHPTPGDISYGFEEFTDTRIPGLGNNGFGSYSQTIDTTQLSEGRHFITARAFRHRDSGTGGDGGPAVFTDFKRAIYVDRFAPESTVVSFDPFASSPNTLQNRDLIVKSNDATASSMHLFLDLPAGLTDEQVLQMALDGQGTAGRYDADSFVFGFQNVGTGNHVATVVTFEPSFDGTNGFTIRRNVGMFTETGVGAGFGDLNFNGQVRTGDLAGFNNGSFEDVLYSQNAKFNAAADLDGNGLVNNLDLYALGPELDAMSGISPTSLNSYEGVLRRRGDLNEDGSSNVGDVENLYAAIGGNAWLTDLNVDGIVDILDVQTLVTEIFQTVNGDFDLDGDVDGRDFLVWQRNAGMPGRYDQGDADLNGAIDASDLAVWQQAYGAAGLTALTATAQAVPEPSAFVLYIVTGLVLVVGARNHSHKSVRCKF